MRDPNRLLLIPVIFLLTITASSTLASTMVQSPPSAETLSNFVHKDSQRNLILGEDSFLGSSGRSLALKSMFFAPIGLILLLAALFLLVPIPVIVPPAAGRSFVTAASRSIDMAQRVMSSDECVERISCEISNFARTYESTSWIPRSVESYIRTSPWKSKMSAGINATQSCKQFKCQPMKTLSKNNKLKNKM